MVFPEHMEFRYYITPERKVSGFFLRLFRFIAKKSPRFCGEIFAFDRLAVFRLLPAANVCGQNA